MNANTICFSGLSREDEVQVQSAFDQANMRLPKRWAATNEKEAELIVIDIDTVYGHMTWLKANAADKIVVAVTSADRAKAYQPLPRPVTLDSLVQLITSLSNQTVSTIPIARTTGQHAAVIPEMLNARSTGQQAVFTASEPIIRTIGTQPAVTAEIPATAPRLTTGT